MKSFMLTSLVALAAFTQTSCGMQKDPGASIGISVTPDTALVVAGKGVSCVAKAAAKKADEVAEADIEGDRVTFTRFALQWRSGDQLTIASIKATFYSTGISGAETTDGLEKILDEEEMNSLLGLSPATITFTNPYNPDRVVNIDSTDTARNGTTSIYAPCGLQFGGLTATKGIKTYTARIKIQVDGFGTSCDEKDDSGNCVNGQQYPVRQTITVRAQKY